MTERAFVSICTLRLSRLRPRPLARGRAPVSAPASAGRGEHIRRGEIFAQGEGGFLPPWRLKSGETVHLLKTTGRQANEKGSPQDGLPFLFGHFI
ncbi:hypothetical protein HMPREF0262_03385 [Clostridium sp. ATCC 29733]|nr:hypothetical protein HMPREF0262_03385 [Clostridium sp. ATCC 29733]